VNLARSYASTLPSPPVMGPDPMAASAEGGVNLSWQRAQSCTAPITGYTVTGTPGNISMTLPPTTTSVWIPGLTDGVSYTFTVTATNVQGTSSLTSNTTIPGPGCTSAAITGNASSPRLAGASTVFTVTSTTCNSPEYAYWVRAPGHYWTLMRDYGGNVWTWTTGGLAPGTYQIEVWARQTGSGKQYDTYGLTTYVLLPSSCQNAGLASSVPAPQVLGTKVTFTASSTACSSPQYQFLLQRPGGSWTVVQPYSGMTTWQFDSAKYGSGIFQVGVWVRQAGSSSRYQSWFASSYLIHAAGGCIVSALNPSAASPQAVGTQVTFTAQKTGCVNQYKFWLMAPGGTWRIVLQYGTASTWVWNTAAYGAGIYQVGVWEGRSSTPSRYESYAITTFTLAPPACASTNLSVSADPPQTPGGTITLTATATGCTSPSYEFWVQPPGGAWTIARPWGSSTFGWNTAGLAPGEYQVGVWARRAGSTASYEAYFIRSFQLTVPACTSATIAANPASPQAAGTAVTFTATSSGCSSLNYEFWEQAPGGIWKVVQPWGGTTFGWSSTGAAIGDYNFAVMARATGSADPYDTYATTTFSING
jgi:Fibronectin type III domain